MVIASPVCSHVKPRHASFMLSYSLYDSQQKQLLFRLVHKLPFGALRKALSLWFLQIIPDSMNEVLRIGRKSMRWYRNSSMYSSSLNCSLNWFQGLYEPFCRPSLEKMGLVRTANVQLSLDLHPRRPRDEVGLITCGECSSSKRVRLITNVRVNIRIPCVGSGTDVSTGDFVGRCGVPDRRSNLEPGLQHFQPGEPRDLPKNRAYSPGHFGTYGYQAHDRVDEAASGHRVCNFSHTPGKDRAVGSLRNADWSPTSGWSTCADPSWCPEWWASCWPTVLIILSTYQPKIRCLYANLRWAK